MRAEWCWYRSLESSRGNCKWEEKRVENVQRFIKGFKWAACYHWHWVAKGQWTYAWNTSKYLINILKHRVSIVLLILLVFHNLGGKPRFKYNRKLKVTPLWIIKPKNEIECVGGEKKVIFWNCFYKDEIFEKVF